jgi:hypothetical protein
MTSDPDDFPELFNSEQALFEVLGALEQASVDPHERRIVWPSGRTAHASPSRRRPTGFISSPVHPSTRFSPNVVGWLEMTYEPKRLDEKQMEEFERLIDRWIAPYDDPL